MRDRFIQLLLAASGVFLLGCTTTQRRALLRWDASTKDYLYFPERKIECGKYTRTFTRKIEPQYEELLNQEFNTESLDKFISKTKTQAIIIIKDDTIVLEKYGAKYSEDSVATSFSVAKSFDSAIIGALIESGKIKSVNEPVTDYIPELLKRDKRFSKISIRHLMLMSSGILYEEKFPRKDNTKTYFNPDLRNLAINSTFIKEEPELHFLYNNYNPLLLGLIIERASGESVSSYFSRAIWSKMGAEADASWSLDSRKSSFEKMESGINARALDFARFGCLYRDGGSADGKVVIEKKWIEESLNNAPKDKNYYNDSWGKQIYNGVNGNGGYYGYFWYVLKRKNAENDFFAYGNKGQFIYVSPAANTVIVRFGEKYGINGWKYIEAFYNLNSKAGDTND